MSNRADCAKARARAAIGLSAALCCACSRAEPTERSRDAGNAPSAPVSQSVDAEAKPELLYLPDGGDIAPLHAPGQEILPGPWGFGRRCPPDMVDVRGQFCIDRFEVSLVDQATARALSPYYHPTRAQLEHSYAHWQKHRLDTGTALGRMTPVPPPPPFQLTEDFKPSARSIAGVTPNGYLSGPIAEQACRNAGKRLCRLEEWVMACRGSAQRKFPYGDQYEAGLCNVDREAHPAQILHGNPSINHLDPRLNLTESEGQPLLRRTGATASCKSVWGEDGVFDMVGNLDEWIEDPGGTFVGGFYSRSTHEGCDARITSHDYTYFDYSLGTRCCK